MMLRTQALGWIDAGGTVELCNSVMAQVIAGKRESGESPPTNLGFCRLGMGVRAFACGCYLRTYRPTT
jgi:hypothetical protein